MGLLDTLERGIEKVVRSAFTGRGGGLGPVEIATAVRRHMDRESTHTGEGPSPVPNLYKIRLSENDFDEAKKYGTALAEELCEEIIRHADSQGYTLPGPVKTTFVKNTDLKRGQISIETQTDRSTSPPARPQHPGHDSGRGPAATAALPLSMQHGRDYAPAPRRTSAQVEHDGRTFTVEASTIIGRSSTADITISDTGISRKHLEIQRVGSRWFARDLGSTNGAVVDGQQLRGTETELHDGAVIALGNAQLRFRLS